MPAEGPKLKIKLFVGHNPSDIEETINKFLAGLEIKLPVGIGTTQSVYPQVSVSHQAVSEGTMTMHYFVVSYYGL